MSTLRDFVSLGFVILMPLISFGQIPTENSFLSSPVSPLFVPDVPVTTALSRLGNAVSGGHVVFGTEILLNAAGQEPHITFQLLPW